MGRREDRNEGYGSGRVSARNPYGGNYPGSRGPDDYEYSRNPDYWDRRHGGHDFDGDFRAPDQADSYDRGLGFGGTEDMHGQSPVACDPRFRHDSGGRFAGRPWDERAAPAYSPSRWRDDDRELMYGARDYRGGGSVNPGFWRDEHGPHIGRGPRGYRPESTSNEQIRTAVCERLTRHGMIDASEIEIKVEDGEVTLEGTVDSRQIKRLVEDVAESVESVRDVHNRLKIQQRAG